MSESEKQTALISLQHTALTKVGAKSLVARGRAELRAREEAEEWFKKGLEFCQKKRMRITKHTVDESRCSVL